MYCPQCAAPMTPGLSFCNRCGANLRERSDSSKTGTINALLTAITIIALVGLGTLIGGSLVLRSGAGLSQELIGVFMLFTFLLTGSTEVMLIRNLSRLIAQPDKKEYLGPVQHQPLELRSAAATTLEPLPSVTENTTRTLGYARREH